MKAHCWRSQICNRRDTKARRLKAAPHEADEQDVANLLKRHQESCKRGVREHRARAQASSVTAGIDMTVLCGSTVFLESDSPAVIALATRSKMVRVRERTLASVVVVNDLSSPQYRSHLAAALGGLALVDSTFTQMLRYKASN